MTLVFFLGVSAYFILMTVIGLLASRHCKTMDDYLIAGRRLPIYLAVPTVVATWFGAGSSMGVSGTVYSQGFYGVLPDPFGCSLALLIAGIFFAVPFRRLRLLTVSDLLRKAYGREFEMASTFVVLPFYVGTLASQMLAMGYIFQIVSGISLELGILIGAFVVVFYTVTGGMWAVTITDFVQFALLSMGLLIVLPICIEHVKDSQAVFETFIGEFSNLGPKGDTQVDWLAYAGRILMTGLGAIVGQDLIQRILAARSEYVARYSSIFGAICYFMLALIPLFIGIAGREIYPSLETPEHLIPLLAKEYLSPLMFTLFGCGLLSAIMSTADSYLLAGTTLLTNNFLLKVWPLSTDQKKIALLRWVSVALSLIALALSYSGHSIFNMMVHSGATLFVGIFVPVTAALYWKGANQAAAWGSLICGISSWLGFIFLSMGAYPEGHEDQLFAAASVGGAVSLVSYLAISLVRFTFMKRKPLATTEAIRA